MASNIEKLTDEIMEKTTPKITATLKDEEDVAIPYTDLTTLTLTLFDLTGGSGGSYAIINNRDAQDILNANGVTVDVNGLLTWVLYANDAQIVDTTKAHEWHRAVIEWTYNSGTKNGKHLIDMKILNLQKTS